MHRSVHAACLRRVAKECRRVLPCHAMQHDGGLAHNTSDAALRMFEISRHSSFDAALTFRADFQAAAKPDRGLVVSPAGWAGPFLSEKGAWRSDQATGVLAGMASSSRIGTPLSSLVARGTASISSPSDVWIVAP